MQLKKKHYSASYYKTQLEDKLMSQNPHHSQTISIYMQKLYQMHSELVVLFYFFQHLMDSISLRILLLENTVQTSTDWMFVCVSVEVYENKWLCTACVLVQQVSEPWSVQPEEQMPGMSHSVVTLLTAHRLDREKHIPASHPLCVCVCICVLQYWASETFKWIVDSFNLFYLSKTKQKTIYGFIQWLNWTESILPSISFSATAYRSCRRKTAV